MLSFGSVSWIEGHCARAGHGKKHGLDVNAHGLSIYVWLLVHLGRAGFLLRHLHCLNRKCSIHFIVMNRIEPSFPRLVESADPFRAVYPTSFLVASRISVPPPSFRGRASGQVDETKLRPVVGQIPDIQSPDGRPRSICLGESVQREQPKPEGGTLARVPRLPLYRQVNGGRPGRRRRFMEKPICAGDARTLQIRPLVRPVLGRQTGVLVAENKEDAGFHSRMVDAPFARQGLPAEELRRDVVEA